MLKHYQIRLNSDIYALVQLQGWFKQFKSLLPNIFWMQCDLVLVEVFTNAVCYAHEGLPEETPIDIELYIDDTEKSIELKIWDYGQPFNLQTEIERLVNEAQKNKDFENVDDIPTGGRGLILTQTIADDSRYESNVSGRNFVAMTKSFAKFQN